jgi:hypothetical protein
LETNPYLEIVISYSFSLFFWLLLRWPFCLWGKQEYSNHSNKISNHVILRPFSMHVTFLGVLFEIQGKIQEEERSCQKIVVMKVTTSPNESGPKEILDQS